MPITEVGAWIVLTSLVGVVYPHVIYSVILKVCCLVFARDVKSSDSYTPSIDVLVSAYNEADTITESLRAVLTSDYPSDKVHVIVGDDGSTDATVAVVSAIGESDPRVRVVECGRQGKNETLNAIIAAAKSDVLVFMDADATFAPDTLRVLLSPLADTTVGASISEIVQLTSLRGNGSNGGYSSLYDRIDRWVNIHESKLHSTVSSNGALYAIRRELVEPMPDRLVADDFVTTLRAMKAGKRVVKQNLARVAECRPNTPSIEIRRKVRTAASGMAAVWAERTMLSPKYGWVAFFLWSHRIVRWLSPLFLVLAFCATWLTIGDPVVFGWFFYSQFAFYSMAFVGYAANKFGQSIPVLTTAHYFVAMNIGMLLGLWKFCMESEIDSWVPGSE